MNKLVFRPEIRPILFLKSELGTQKAEVHELYHPKDETNPVLTLSTARSLPAFGTIEGDEFETIKFTRLNEIVTEDEDILTEIEITHEEFDDLLKHLLLGLPSEDLSEWLIDNLEELESIQPIEDGPIHENQEQEHPIRTKLGMIEKLFYQGVSTIYKYPILGLLLLLLFTIPSFYALPKIKMDPSLDRILVKDSFEMKKYKEALSYFGSDKSIILYFKDKNIFANENLETLRQMAWDFQKWDELARVNSIFTSSFIHNDTEDDTLYTEPLFQNIPTKKEKKFELLQKVKNDPILHGRLINVEQNIVVFNLVIKSDQKDMHLLARKMENFLKEKKLSFEYQFQTGEPAIELFNTKEMKRSSLLFIPLILFVLLISFYFFLKSLDAFIITVIATGFSLLWVAPFMIFLEIPIQIMVVLVPGIVLTLSATEIVHLISSLKHGKEKGLKNEELIHFLGLDISKAIFLTFTSTALGFLSISFSEIQVLKEFSVVSFLTLIFAFLATLIVLPLMLKLTNIFNHEHKNYEQQQNKWFNRIEPFFESIYLNAFFTRKTIFAALLFTLLSLLLSSRVIIDNDNIAMISDSTQVKKDLITFKKEVGGLKNIHIIINSQDNSLLTTPENLSLLWKIHEELAEHPQVKSVESFPGILALLNREMISGEEKDYKVPTSKNLIAQYLLTLGRDDIDPVLSPDKLKTNIKIGHDISSSKKTEVFVNEIKGIIKKELQRPKGDNLSFYLTSRNILNIHAANTIITSQSLSLLTMSLVIILLVSLFFKSFEIGLISLIPNLFPIIGLFGFMGLFNVPLNIGTCIVAAITIGIAADDTIHLFTRYFNTKNHGANAFQIGKATIREELVPIMTTSLSLALSFLTFSFANFLPLFQFGVLSAYVLILAVISDLYIGPAVLTWFDLRRAKKTGNFLSLLFPNQENKNLGLLSELSWQELITLLKAGNLSSHYYSKIGPKAEYFTLILNGQLKEEGVGDLVQINQFATEPTLVLRIPKRKLENLSPRIFSIFCHNQKR